jgi:hypothetical protein
VNSVKQQIEVEYLVREQVVWQVREQVWDQVWHPVLAQVWLLVWHHAKEQALAER